MHRLAQLVGKSKVVFVLAATVIVVVLASVGIAAAQTPTPNTTPQAGKNYGQAFWQSLAQRLNITVDVLQQAVKDAAKDVVAQQVQDGRLTQDQANSLNQRIDQWVPSQGGFEGFMGKGFGPGFGKGGAPGFYGGPAFFGGQATLDAAAKALSLSTADLTAELRAGKTLADVAKEKNVDVNAVKQALVDAAKAQIDQLQQSGKLTQDQATQMKQKIDQDMANWDLSQPFFGKGMPFGHEQFRGKGMPGHRNPGNQNPGNQTPGSRQNTNPRTPSLQPNTQQKS